MNNIDPGADEAVVEARRRACALHGADLVVPRPVLVPEAAAAVSA